MTLKPFARHHTVNANTSKNLEYNWRCQTGSIIHTRDIINDHFTYIRNVFYAKVSFLLYIVHHYKLNKVGVIILSFFYNYL